MRSGWSVVTLVCMSAAAGFCWGPVAVCEYSGLQLFPVVVSNQKPDNGAIVAWQDSRDGHCEVYTKEIRGDSGTTAPGWNTSGNPASTPPPEFTPYGHRLSCAATRGGTGEVIAVWVNHHKLTVPGKTYTPGIYAQKMKDGSTQWYRWLGSEVGVEVVADVTTPPAICSDGAGGCVVAVIEADQKTIKAWRLHSDGTFYTGNWGGSAGLSVRTGTTPVRNVKVVWGGNGAYVFWWDYRNFRWYEQPPRYEADFYCGFVSDNGGTVSEALIDQFYETYGQPLRPYAVCGGNNCAYAAWANEVHTGEHTISACTLTCARLFACHCSSADFA